uniref:Uncharacterized protein n=1 Tax=Tanacetum cinerariifolium TaxID=118510 RepID=A0A6L2P7L4_TANCI|nr:hypothetical protein [Tanacetum cinerariifolium]
MIGSEDSQAATLSKNFESLNEVAFDNGKGTLALGLIIQKQVIETFVMVLNDEDMIKTGGKYIRRHCFPTNALINLNLEELNDCQDGLVRNKLVNFICCSINIGWLKKQFLENKAEMNAKGKRKCKETELPGRWTRGNEARKLAEEHKKTKQEQVVAEGKRREKKRKSRMIDLEEDDDESYNVEMNETEHEKKKKVKNVKKQKVTSVVKG